MLVMFDLPTDTKSERREATRFRNALLDKGYLMLQYSVYAKCAITLDKKASLVNTLRLIAPSTGDVKSIFITDSQWGKTIAISRSEKPASKRKIDKADGVGEQLQFW